MANTELQFEIAMRDEVIYNLREAQSNLWNLLLSFGLSKKQILDLAAKQGILIEDWRMTPQLKLSESIQCPSLGGRKYPPASSPSTSQHFIKSSCSFPLNQYFYAR